MEKYFHSKGEVRAQSEYQKLWKALKEDHYFMEALRNRKKERDGGWGAKTGRKRKRKDLALANRLTFVKPKEGMQVGPWDEYIDKSPLYNDDFLMHPVWIWLVSLGEKYKINRGGKRTEDFLREKVWTSLGTKGKMLEWLDNMNEVIDLTYFFGFLPDEAAGTLHKAINAKEGGRYLCLRLSQTRPGKIRIVRNNDDVEFYDPANRLPPFNATAFELNVKNVPELYPYKYHSKTCKGCGEEIDQGKTHCSDCLLFI